MSGKSEFSTKAKSIIYRLPANKIFAKTISSLKFWEMLILFQGSFTDNANPSEQCEKLYCFVLLSESFIFLFILYRNATSLKWITDILKESTTYYIESSLEKQISKRSTITTITFEVNVLHFPLWQVFIYLIESTMNP